MKRRVLNGRALECTPEVKLIRQLCVVVASLYLPDIINSLGERASNGNVKCAELLFSYLGFYPASTGKE